MADTDYLIKTSTLTGIADAIREMGVEAGVQITYPLSPLEMPGAIRQVHSSEVTFVGNLKYSEGYDSAREEFYQPRYQEGYAAGLEQGEIDGKAEINTLANSASVTTGTVLEGTTFYKNGQTLTGTMPNNSIQTIYLDATTKKYTIPTGYHSSGGSVQVRTTTGSGAPGTSNKTYTPTNGYLYSGFTVQGDSNLKSENIKSGTSIFGVQGSYCTPKDYTFTNNGKQMYLIAIKPDGVGIEDVTDTDPYVINDWYPDGTVLSLIPGTIVYICTAEGSVNDVMISSQDKYMASTFIRYGLIGAAMDDGFFMLC